MPKLLDLWKEYELTNEKAIMLRNIAKYHYRNDNKKAIKKYEKAFQIADARYVDILVTFNTELAEPQHLAM